MINLDDEKGFLAALGLIVLTISGVAVWFGYPWLILVYLALAVLSGPVLGTAMDRMGK